jgi:hypothetical protein
MPRKFEDIAVYASRNMSGDGNIDKGYWFNKTIEERLEAATGMIEVAFGEPFFVSKKCNRKAFSARKHQL